MGNRRQYAEYIKQSAKDGLSAFAPRIASSADEDGDGVKDKAELQDPTTKEKTWDGMNAYNQLPAEKRQTNKPLYNLTNKNKVNPPIPLHEAQ